MLDNCTISFIVTTGAGTDANGNTIAPTKTASAFVKANLAILSKHYVVRVEGEEQRARYSVIVDGFLYDSLALLKLPTQAEIKDSEGITMGVHKIHLRNGMPFSKKYKFIVGVWE